MGWLARFLICSAVGLTVGLSAGCSKDKSDDKRDDVEKKQKPRPPSIDAGAPTTDAAPKRHENTDFDVPTVIE